MEETRNTDATAAVEIVRHYPAPPARVWRAWTDPQALSRWFGPGEPGSVTHASLDVQVGGLWSIRFRTPDGQEHGVSGVYQEVESPHRLVFSWAWQSTPERVSRVALAFVADSGGTRMTLRHDRFFDAQARANHERGWGPTIAKLGDWLAPVAP